MNKLIAVLTVLNFGLVAKASTGAPSNVGWANVPRAYSEFQKLVRTGCVAFSARDGIWVFSEVSSNGTVCEYEDLDLDQIELANIRSSPLTLAC